MGYLTVNNLLTYYQKFELIKHVKIKLCTN